MKVRLVFDDVGFIYSNPDNTGFKLEFSLYDRLLELAKRHEIKIGLACTAKFFDIDGIYSTEFINPEADKLLKLIKDNPEQFEVYNHGLKHTCGDQYTEFFSYETGNVDSEQQRESLALSQQIFNKLGFACEALVPPGHAWEQGTTDKLAAQYGLSEIHIREFEKKPIQDAIASPSQRFKSTWENSEYLKTCYRLGLGIRYNQTAFGKKNFIKLALQFKPNRITNLLLHRKAQLQYKPDHYFAHVQNLQSPDSVRFFNNVIDKIKNEFQDTLDK